MQNDILFLYITFPSQYLAIEMANQCLERKLIACANIVPETISIYEWKNKIEQTKETIAIFKTTKDKKEILSKFIKENHQYDCPCIAALEIEILNKDFSTWIQEYVK